MQVSKYIPGRYEVKAYGDGLPLELRVKLGIYRLNLGDDNFEEARVRSQLATRLISLNLGYRTILSGLIQKTLTQVLRYLTTLINSEKLLMLFEGGSFSVKLCNSISHCSN